MLTIHFQFTKFVIRVLRIVARISHITPTFVVVKNITSENRTVNSLVL